MEVNHLTFQNRAWIIIVRKPWLLYIFSTILGFLALGNIVEGIGALVGLVGVGTLIAGYLYPNTGKELTDAVEEFEKK